MIELEKAFEQTYTALFGACHQTMDELHDYLLRHQYNLPIYVPSPRTGKPVTLCSPNYSKNKNFISHEEVDFTKKYIPLDLNSIKDIDSLITSLGERFEYTGNKVFGNSQHIENSDNCTDSYFVQNSHNIESSKYVAYSAYVRTNCEYIFGCSHMINGKYKLKFFGGVGNSRCFETYLMTQCSDAYFSSYCHSCSDVMFSFNARSKRNCIGNLALEKSKYLQIKKQLLVQMREYLEKHKKFYSIFDFAPPTPAELAPHSPPIIGEKSGNLKPMEDSFKLTTKLVLGKELSPLDAYAPFLSLRTEPIRSVTSPFGSTLAYSDYFINKHVPKHRMINAHESVYLSDKGLSLDKIEGTPLAKLISNLSSIAFFPANFRIGSDENNVLCPYVYDASDGYKTSDNTMSKKVAYCIHPHSCEAMFGCGVLVKDCKYCLRCYNSTKLTMCMDCDSCSNSSNCLFCHNVENCTECMFCFNVKAKRYAIGNVEYPKEEYMKMKKRIMDELVTMLEKNKKLDIDIYNLGVKR